MNKEKIIRAYNRIMKVYLEDADYILIHHNPIKISMELGAHRRCASKTTNVMSASTENGNIAKVISIDDDSGRTNEHIIYTDNDMNVRQFENIGLTTIRCAIMACVAIALNFDVKENTKIGFIGNGKINLKTLEVFNALFGEHYVFIRGSRNNRYKNLTKFQHVNMYKPVEVDDTEDLKLLNTCDIVISCTSFCCNGEEDVKEMISYDKLNHPNLFVIQDGGYLFDESFRKNVESYSDYGYQLMKHRSEEFPFDSNSYYFGTMNKTVVTYEEDLQKAVYLYGIALADAIVLEECFLEKRV